MGVLAQLFPSLIPPCGPMYLLGLALPFLLFGAVVGGTYRYYDRMAFVVLAVGTWVADKVGPPDEEVTIEGLWPTATPRTEVERAWTDMVKRADVDRPWQRTSTQCARDAIDAGLNAEAVRELTRLFEEVRYGGAPVDDERRRQARELSGRLDTLGNDPADGPMGRQLANDGGDRKRTDGSGDRRPTANCGDRRIRDRIDERPSHTDMGNDR